MVALRRSFWLGLVVAAWSTVSARAEPLLLDPVSGVQVPQVWYLRVDYPPLDRLELAPGATAVFYLLVNTQSAVTVPMTLLSRQAMARERGESRLMLGLFFGILLALAGYNLLLYVSIRDPSYLLYVAFVVLSGLAYFDFNGLAYQYLWPESVWWNNRGSIVLALLALSAGVVFTRSFLAVRNHAPRLDRSLMAIAAISGALALLALGAVSYRAAAQIFALLGIVSALAVFAAGWVCHKQGNRSARWFLLAWAATMVGLVSYGLRALGALPGNLFSIYGLQIGCALGMVLLSVALAHRINIVMREKTQPNADASAATQRPEREVDSSVVVQMEELNQLNQLNRKLQDEIAERRRAEDALFEMAHHDALTGLPNRLLLGDRFQIAAAQAKRSGRELALLMLDLDDFKQVNDTLGHTVGDALLVNVAEVIQTSVRAADTVARFGGDEYVVLLGNMIDSDEAAHVAEKIIKSLSEVKKVRRHDVRVAPSIGIALYPQDGLDMTALLKSADIAMYRAKRAGGNNYYFFTEARQRQLSLPVMQRE